MVNQQPCPPEYRHKGFGNHPNPRFPTAGRNQRPGSIDTICEQTATDATIRITTSCSAVLRSNKTEQSCYIQVPL